MLQLTNFSTWPLIFSCQMALKTITSILFHTENIYFCLSKWQKWFPTTFLMLHKNFHWVSNHPTTFPFLIYVHTYLPTYLAFISLTFYYFIPLIVTLTLSSHLSTHPHALVLISPSEKTRGVVYDNCIGLLTSLRRGECLYRCRKVRKSLKTESNIIQKIPSGQSNQ